MKWFNNNQKQNLSSVHRGSSQPKIRGLGKFQRGSAISATTSGLTRADMQMLSRNRAKIARLLAFSLGVVILIAVIVTQTIYDPVIVLEGADGASVDKYTTLMAEYFKTNPAERLRSMLNVKSANAFLATFAPEVERIESIKTGFGRRSEIKLVVRRPVVMWESSGKKYYVDALGVPFTVNYFADPTIVVDDRSGVSLSSVDRVANDNFIGFIGQAVAVANQMGLVVKKIIIPPLTTRQLELYVNDFQFPVKMSTVASVVRQISDASRVINFLQKRGVTPAYIDVRVERKTYYK